MAAMTALRLRAREEEGMTEPTPEADAALEVGVVGNRLVISIGVSTLAFTVVHGAGVEEDMRITDPLAAAREIAQYLQQEDEEGTTPVHTLLDKAAWDAWENGGKGFAEGPGPTEPRDTPAP